MTVLFLYHAVLNNYVHCFKMDFSLEVLGQTVFIEHLACGRHCAGCKETGTDSHGWGRDIISQLLKGVSISLRAEGRAEWEA